MSAAVKACPVTQEDREAAAAYWKSQGIGTASSYRSLKGGKRDDSDLVQAFARHRLATRPDRDQALDYLEAEARRFAGMYPEASDGRNTFVIFADKIAALKSTGPK